MSQKFVLYSMSSMFGYVFPWSGLLYNNPEEYSGRKWIVDGVRPVASWTARYKKAQQCVEVVAVRADKAAEFETYFGHFSDHVSMALFRASSAEIVAVVNARRDRESRYGWTTRKGVQSADRLGDVELSAAFDGRDPASVLRGSLEDFPVQAPGKFVPASINMHSKFDGLWDPSTWEPIV